MIRTYALAATAALGALVAVPAGAQEAAGSESYNTVIIYGDDACPTSTGDTITVCARMDESERYRVPPNLRQSSDPANKSWADRVRSFESVGEFGPLSCTPIGAGGELGCTMEMIEAAYAEKRENPGIRFSQLIDQARSERLSEIDAEAAATQQRVEALERSYTDRLEAERRQALPGESTDGEEVVPEVVAPGDMPPPPES